MSFSTYSVRPLYNFPRSLTKLLTLHLTPILLRATQRAIHRLCFTNCSVAMALSCKRSTCLHFSSIWPGLDGVLPCGLCGVCALLRCASMLLSDGCTVAHGSALFCTLPCCPHFPMCICMFLHASAHSCTLLHEAQSC